MRKLIALEGTYTLHNYIDMEVKCIVFLYHQHLTGFCCSFTNCGPMYAIVKYLQRQWILFEKYYFA